MSENDSKKPIQEIEIEVTRFPVAHPKFDEKSWGNGEGGNDDGGESPTDC